MVCFIVLHYLLMRDTITCVSSLLNIKGDKKIVIVDNASENDSGQELKEYYADNEDVVVLINNRNMGFAKGNNVGCKYARETFDPQFYVVLNNDVEVMQNDFIDLMTKTYSINQFDVLGPDIFCTTTKTHQSPKSLRSMTLDEAKKLQNQYEKKIKSGIIVPLRCFIKQFDFFARGYNRRKNKSLGIDYQRLYYNIPLHGSCMIFSKKFVDQRENVFFPNTFFYFETEILDYECHKEGYLEVYNPEMKVLHNHNASTNALYGNSLKKVRFMNIQNYRSITAFLKEYGK